MIKYIVTTNSKLIKFNTETQDISTQDNISNGIDWVWVIEEDGFISNQEVNAGDVVLSMYPVDRNIRSDERDIFIIKDEKLKDYYKRAIEFHKARYQQMSNACEEASDIAESPYC